MQSKYLIGSNAGSERSFIPYRVTAYSYLNIHKYSKARQGLRVSCDRTTTDRAVTYRTGPERGSTDA